MDAFDNQVKIVSKKMYDIKTNIDTIKTKNTETINNIFQSISSLSNFFEKRPLYTRKMTQNASGGNTPLKKHLSVYSVRKRVANSNRQSFRIQNNFSNQMDIKEEHNEKAKNIINIEEIKPKKDTCRKKEYKNLYNKKIKNMNVIRDEKNTFCNINDANDIGYSNEKKKSFFSPLTNNPVLAYTKRKVNNVFKKKCDNSGYIQNKWNKCVPLIAHEKEDDDNNNNTIKSSDFYQNTNEIKEPNYKEIVWKIVSVLNQKEQQVNIDNVLEYIKDISTNKDNIIDFDERNYQICNYDKVEVVSKNNSYEDFVKDLMKTYEVKSLSQMKLFIKELLDNGNTDERFLFGMKKILFMNYSNNKYIETEFNNSINNEE